MCVESLANRLWNGRLGNGEGIDDGGLVSGEDGGRECGMGRRSQVQESF